MIRFRNLRVAECWLALVGVALLAAGCTDNEKVVGDYLKNVGFSGIVLKRIDKRSFNYTARKGVMQCVGSITVRTTKGKRRVIRAQRGCKLAPGVTPYKCTTDDYSRCRAQCAAGHAVSCAWIGTTRGKQGKRKVAASYYKKACELKHAKSCAWLGRMFAIGFGVKKSAKKAIILLTRGCRGGYNRACLTLADAFVSGNKWVKKDPKRARPLLQAACLRKDLRGCRELAKLFASGAGGKPDKPRALKLFHRACVKGDAEACSGAAGLTDDKAKAAALRAKACKGGYKAACGDGAGAGSGSGSGSGSAKKKG